jgi:excisionase family DNA binding protein
MDALLTIDEVADLLGVSKQLIYSWRHQSKGPPAIALEGRLLRWRPEDVGRWLDAGRDT